MHKNKRSKQKRNTCLYGHGLEIHSPGAGVMLHYWFLPLRRDQFIPAFTILKIEKL